jgi:hypothetical protein
VRAGPVLTARALPVGGRVSDEFFLLRCSERLDELVHVALLVVGTLTEDRMSCDVQRHIGQKERISAGAGLRRQPGPLTHLSRNELQSRPVTGLRRMER